MSVSFKIFGTKRRGKMTDQLFELLSGFDAGRPAAMAARKFDDLDTCHEQ